MRNDDTPLTARIISNAKQCVKCGLCAPHCPTYGLSMNENESSRGRISLMEGLAKKEIPLTESTLKYLDHCLTCRACEAACPSEVHYGELIDDTRRYLADKRPIPKSLQQLGWIMARPGRLRALQFALYWLQKSGVLALIRKTRLAQLFGKQRLLELLPKLTLPWWGKRGIYPAQGTSKGHVGLFLGCVNQWSDKPVYLASIRLLNALGYDVFIPTQQTCCGALWQHAGLHEPFSECQKRNQYAFPEKMDVLVSIASGCTVTLQDYDPPLAMPVREICTFLAEEFSKNPLKFKILKEKMAIHTPCSQRNVLKSKDRVYACLQAIPGLQLVPLTDKAHCCGAAGLNMLQSPETADPLVAQTLAQLLELQVKTICTTNIGCHLHMQRALRQNGCRVEIKHPVTLLAEQLA